MCLIKNQVMTDQIRTRLVASPTKSIKLYKIYDVVLNVKNMTARLSPPYYGDKKAIIDKNGFINSNREKNDPLDTPTAARRGIHCHLENNYLINKYSDQVVIEVEGFLGDFVAAGQDNHVLFSRVKVDKNKVEDQLLSYAKRKIAETDKEKFALLKDNLSASKSNINYEQRLIKRHMKELKREKKKLLEDKKLINKFKKTNVTYINFTNK